MRKYSMLCDEDLKLLGKRIWPKQGREFRGPMPGHCCVVTAGTGLQAWGICRKLPCKVKCKRMRGKLS